MRQVNIKELKARLSKELLNLPFEITRYGRVIGVIGEKGSHNELKLEKPKKLTTCNNNAKTTSHTGPVHYFNPCPKKWVSR
jgi:hypothetical protein